MGVKPRPRNRCPLYVGLPSIYGRTLVKQTWLLPVGFTGSGPRTSLACLEQKIKSIRKGNPCPSPFYSPCYLPFSKLSSLGCLSLTLVDHWCAEHSPREHIWPTRHSLQAEPVCSLNKSPGAVSGTRAQGAPGELRAICSSLKSRMEALTSQLTTQVPP